MPCMWSLNACPWAPVQITDTQNQQKRKLFRSHSSLTPQQGMVSHLNCPNHYVWFYRGSCVIGIEWRVWIRRCTSVWLMIVVVCVSRLGEEYGCLEWWARVICFLLRSFVLWIFFFDFF